MWREIRLLNNDWRVGIKITILGWKDSSCLCYCIVFVGIGNNINIEFLNPFFVYKHDFSIFLLIKNLKEKCSKRALNTSASSVISDSICQSNCIIHIFNWKSYPDIIFSRRTYISHHHHYLSILRLIITMFLESVAVNDEPFVGVSRVYLGRADKVQWETWPIIDSGRKYFYGWHERELEFEALPWLHNFIVNAIYFFLLAMPIIWLMINHLHFDCGNQGWVRNYFSLPICWGRWCNLCVGGVICNTNFDWSNTSWIYGYFPIHFILCIRFIIRVLFADASRVQLAYKNCSSLTGVWKNNRCFHGMYFHIDELIGENFHFVLEIFSQGHSISNRMVSMDSSHTKGVNWFDHTCDRDINGLTHILWNHESIVRTRNGANDWGSIIFTPEVISLYFDIAKPTNFVIVYANGIDLGIIVDIFVVFSLLDSHPVFECPVIPQQSDFVEIRVF